MVTDTAQISGLLSVVLLTSPYKLTVKGSYIKRFFTLVELLIIIAIIALLTSILLPALNLAKEKGKSTVCKGNLKQLAISLISYSMDNNGGTPYALDWSRAPYYTYYDLLAEGYVPLYVYNKSGIWTCPSAPLPSAPHRLYGFRVGSQAPSWGFRILMNEIPYTPNPVIRSFLPSRFIIIGDSRDGTDPQQYVRLDDNAYGGSVRTLPAIRHLTEINTGFADGHVAGLKGNDLLINYTNVNDRGYFFSNYLTANGVKIGYY